MRQVNLYKFLLIKFFQKCYEATKRFHFLNCLKYVCYGIYFHLLKNTLDPYLELSLNNIKCNNYYKGNNNSNIIWVFWWQGYSYMPVIVKHCIASIKKHRNDHKVVLITRYNIRKYTDIPDYIYKKVKKGYITLTHFSDILRFNLLNNHGGLWCDATMYSTSNLGERYFDYLYTCGGYTGTPPKFVAGRWTGFLIGGNDHNALFQFMCNYFNLYWKFNKYQVAYFLIDLGLHYAYINNIGNFKIYTDNVASSHNPNMFKLADLLNKPYNAHIFHQIINNTNMFKLTYKMKFNNNNTFYYHIINR